MWAGGKRITKEIQEDHKEIKFRGTWLAQRPTLGLGSGRDLSVREIEPCIRLCADSVEPAWGSLSLPLSLLLTLPRWLMFSLTPSFSK